MLAREQFESQDGFEEALRNWFAGHVAAALCSATDSSGTWTGPIGADGPQCVAERAYSVADAMLAERQKGGDA